jgi:hypothetical protein
LSGSQIDTLDETVAGSNFDLESGLGGRVVVAQVEDAIARQMASHPDPVEDHVFFGHAAIVQVGGVTVCTSQRKSFLSLSRTDGRRGTAAMHESSAT